MSKFASCDVVSESVASVELSPARRVGCLLRFDPSEGISLTIHDASGEAVMESFADRPVLYGRLAGGPPFTLVDCLTTRSHFGAGDVADIRIEANQLLVGCHLKDVEATAFDEVTVSFNSLDQWCDMEPIQANLEKGADGKHSRTTVSCVRVERFEFTSTTGGPTLIGGQAIGCDLSKRPREASISNRFLLTLRPRAPFNLRGCIAEVFRLQAFVTLLSGRQSFCDSATLKLAGVDPKVRNLNPVSFLPVFAQPSNKQLGRRQDMLLTLPMVWEQFPSLWTTWTERYELYHTPIELFMSTELFDGQMLNFQFLAVMQALETLHRNCFGGTYCSEVEYGAVATSLAGAIPPTVTPDHRTSLKSRIKYANEFSLRKRLAELARGLPESIRALIHPDIFAFLNRAGETRNFLTHRSAELEATAFRDAQLHWANRILRWFFTAVILSDLGVSEGTLVDAIGKASDLKNARLCITGASTTGGIEIIHVAKGAGTPAPE